MCAHAILNYKLMWLGLWLMSLQYIFLMCAVGYVWVYTHLIYI